MDERPVRILVVDDQEVIRALVTKLLRSRPSLALAGLARDGREALEVLDSNPADVVITDVSMPVMDGIALTRAVKERFPHIHVVGFSSADDMETQEAMRAAGASGYIARKDVERLTRALDIIAGLGADRRRAERPRVVAKIW